MNKFHYSDLDEINKDPFNNETQSKSEFEELLELEGNWASSKRFKMGENIVGKIVSIGQEYIFIDLGGKNAGAIAVDEFKIGGTGLIPQVGDEISAFVRSDNGSEIILTKSLRRNETDDFMIRHAFEQNLPLEAKVEKTIKGGFEVSVGGKRAFVPMSGMDITMITDPDKYIGNIFNFMIVTYAQGGRNIVLSRRSILKEEQEKIAQTLVSSLEVSHKKLATITRITTFGAFADLGGVEGLIPISDLSWTKVKKVDDIVKVAEKVMVKITKIETTPKLKIALSLKDAGEDPWISAATSLIPGSVLDAKITSLMDYGAFASVADGVEGLIHVSQLSWEKRIAHPKEVLQIGQIIPVHVLNIDLAERKLSLSVKGNIPEEMAKHLEAKKRVGVHLSPDETNNLKDWADYQKNTTNKFTNVNNTSNNNALAAAFSRAKTKK